MEGGRGWVCYASLNHFQFFVSACSSPGVQTAMAVQNQRAYKSLKERRWFSSSVKNSHSAFTQTKKGDFSLQLQCPVLKPTQGLEPPKAQCRVAKPGQMLLGSSSTPFRQKYPVSAWRNPLALTKYTTRGCSVSHMAFLCLCYKKIEAGGYTLKQVRS